MLPPRPDGLEKLLSSRRGAFAVAWRSIEEIGELPQIARMLARADWSPESIVSALMHHGCEPGESASERMAVAATEREQSARAEGARAEVAVVAVVLADPPLVDVSYKGKTVRLEIREVGNRALLRAACLSAFLAAPKLPGAKDYDQWLTASLQSAEHIDETEDANDATTERHVVESAIASLPRCEEPRQMRQHRVWLDADDDGVMWAYLHQPSLLAEVLRPHTPSMTARRCCEVLRELGWEPSQVRDGEEVLRVWRGTRGDVDARIESVAAEVASLDEARNRRAAEWRKGGEA